MLIAATTAHLRANAHERYQLSVCFEIVTEESAADGDVAERGFRTDREPATLTDVVAELSRCSELSSCPIRQPDDLTGYEWASTEPDQDYRTGEYESESVHILMADGSRPSPRELYRLFRAAGLVTGTL